MARSTRSVAAEPAEPVDPGDIRADDAPPTDDGELGEPDVGLADGDELVAGAESPALLRQRQQRLHDVRIQARHEGRAKFFLLRVARFMAVAAPNTAPRPNLTVDELALFLLLEANYEQLDDERVACWGSSREGLAVWNIREALGGAQSSTSDLIDKAERAGWVARTRDTRDHRRTRVTLTPRGHQLRRRRRGRDDET